jgi:hypothetical protein
MNPYKNQDAHIPISSFEITYCVSIKLSKASKRFFVLLLIGRAVQVLIQEL